MTSLKNWTYFWQKIYFRRWHHAWWCHQLEPKN